MIQSDSRMEAPVAIILSCWQSASKVILLDYVFEHFFFLRVAVFVVS